MGAITHPRFLLHSINLRERNFLLLRPCFSSSSSSSSSSGEEKRKEKKWSRAVRGTIFHLSQTDVWHHPPLKQSIVGGNQTRKNEWRKVYTKDKSVREENQFPSRFFFSWMDYLPSRSLALKSIWNARSWFPFKFLSGISCVFFPRSLSGNPLFGGEQTFPLFLFSQQNGKKSPVAFLVGNILFSFSPVYVWGTRPENRPLTENGLPQNKYLRKKVVFFKFLFFNVWSRAFLRILYGVRSERKTNNSKE